MHVVEEDYQGVIRLLDAREYSAVHRSAIGRVIVPVLVVGFDLHEHGVHWVHRVASSSEAEAEAAVRRVGQKRVSRTRSGR
ncbi:hypothetical protein Rhow_004535 [Rhodococcus wratislaviensis]|uniref:Uncharacterized protein n=1 Tax=Rhodococcus wratislaviensis TaxID=44752 RepID=A0A402CB74_RHOWR|nr:hypothetical protein Rhow_004535 [Rhodococcus wratislaviensis]